VFTGLVEEVGVVRSVSAGSLRVRCSRVLEDVKIGDSISVNGVCLSVVAFDRDSAIFDVSPTTQSLTRLCPGKVAAGELVNLERALRYSDRLGGHLVTGHVDGVARLTDVSKHGEFAILEFLYPENLRTLIAKKGSVAIDGVSLTVAELRSRSFTVAIIPQTLAATNFKDKRVGHEVHIEVDMFARYVHHMLTTGVVSKEVI
jgi:riboflavin synthase